MMLGEEKLLRLMKRTPPPKKKRPIPAAIAPIPQLAGKPSVTWQGGGYKMSYVA